MQSPFNTPSSAGSHITVFVGNLSILCNEQSLYELFSQFGPISRIRLKKSEKDIQRGHLSYGFIDFCFPSSVERALAMNNTMLLGRELRVGRAEDSPTHHNHRKMKELEDRFKPIAATSPITAKMTTAQVHVQFVVHSLHTIVSEVTLRQIFGELGHLVDVVIKKNVAHDVLGLQSGYGFIHYRFDEKGIESALRAVEIMHQRSIRGVTYECSLTHGLKTHLISLKKMKQSIATTFAPQFHVPAPVLTPDFSNNGLTGVRVSNFLSDQNAYSNEAIHYKRENYSNLLSGPIKRTFIGLNIHSKSIDMMENIHEQLADFI